MDLRSKIQVIPRRILTDDRGWFLKIMTGSEEHLLKTSMGEIYITHGKPYSIKGGHYHPMTNEWFTCIYGEVTLRLEDIVTHEQIEFVLSADSPQTIYVPSNVAHTFFSKSDMFFSILAYADRVYDSKDTIMFPEKKI